ncbi:MAG: hypothetical protein LUD15_13970 [Bacteroides sp.]|nr:hypothetical protein [Bacteroides sp.]
MEYSLPVLMQHFEEQITLLSTIKTHLNKWNSWKKKTELQEHPHSLKKSVGKKSMKKSTIGNRPVKMPLRTTFTMNWM